MSDNAPTATPIRKLRSPFNGEIWQVPPDVSPELYEALVLRDFVPVDDDGKPLKKVKR